MGIDISINRVITLNLSHEKRVVTGIARNPKISMIGRSPHTSVFSIYRRTKVGDFKRDGNPLMYALKGINGYSIKAFEIYKFRTTFFPILSTIQSNLAAGKSIIIPMPSSSYFVTAFSTILAKRFNAAIIDMFQKRTVQEVLSSFSNVNSPIVVKQRHINDVNTHLAALNKLPPNSIFSMKTVPNKIRIYFNPIKIIPNFNTNILNGAQIILVDDLLSSGNTLVSATEHLMQNNFQASMAICLLSDIN